MADKKCPNTIFGKNLIFLRIKRDVFLLSSNTPFFKSIKIIDDSFLVIRVITYLHKTCCHGQKEPSDWTTLSLIKNNKRKIVVNGLCVSSLSVSNDSGIKSSCSCQCKCEWGYKIASLWSITFFRIGFFLLIKVILLISPRHHFHPHSIRLPIRK